MDPNFTNPATFLELFHFFAPKVFFAILCGGIVGLEREIKQKSAGIKTNMLICVGASLFTALSVLISHYWAASGHIGDPARLAAQIVSGIGFLGGGAIIQARGTVHGMTTAATIWVVAAIGVTVGLGYSSVGIVVSILVVSVLILVTVIESLFLGRTLSFSCEINICDPEGTLRKSVNDALAANDLAIDDFDISDQGKNQIIRIEYRGRRPSSQKFILSLWAMNGVREVKQR